MRALVLLFVASGLARPAGSVEAFGFRWTVPEAAEWRVEGAGENQVLRMLAARPATQPRRPVQYALAETPAFSEVTLEAEVKRDLTSLILVYAWRDENHFNYAHLSVDTGRKQPVHNGIFHVYGGDRVRIGTEDGPAALPSTEWTPVRLVYNAKTGLVEVTVRGEKLPALQGVDLSLGAGRVGLGSFFETAQFRKVRIRGR
jgi:hypothetical protein